MKRTFIAVKITINKQTEEFICGIQKALHKEAVSWVDTRNMHITLRFLGDTNEDLIDGIGGRLSEHLNKFSSFDLECKGFGIFKNLYNPRVLWLGIEKPEKLARLKVEIDNVLQPSGYLKEKRGFYPHLTLGRVKGLNDKETLKSLLLEYGNKHIQRFTIDQVNFYESILTRRGAVYKTLREFMLD